MWKAFCRSVGIALQLEAPQGQQEEPQRLPETMQQPSAAPQPEAPDEQQEEPQRLDDAVMPEGPPQQEDTNVTVTSRGPLLRRSHAPPFPTLLDLELGMTY